MEDVWIDVYWYPVTGDEFVGAFEILDLRPSTEEWATNQDCFEVLVSLRRSRFVDIYDARVLGNNPFWMLVSPDNAAPYYSNPGVSNRQPIVFTHPGHKRPENGNGKKRQ